MGLFSALLDLIFPPRCVFCRKVLKSDEKSICAECDRTISRTRNGGFKTGEFFSVCTSPLFYEGKVRDSILRYKFKNASHYAYYYGGLVANSVTDNLSGRYDLITWVPLSSKRLKRRGYDQAMLLAMSTALKMDDVAVELLVKHIDIPAQSGIGGAEKRRANINGAYRVQDEELIRGKRILLIDDIITTGATLSECSRVLRMAGAADVVCATVVRGRE